MAPTAGGTLETRPKTASVLSTNINFRIMAAGDIGPAEQVSVRPEINGKIETMPVDLGDKVKRGDVLFTLDDKDLQTERASRLTEIERADLQLDKARRNFERSEMLFNDKLISQELYEDTKTEFSLAKNALDRSKKELNLVEDRLTKTKISAPFDCTVLTRPVSVGQAVSGSGGFNSGTEVMSIANLTDMVVNAHINQSDITRVKVDQEVAIVVESVPGLQITGQVERIAPQTTLKNNIKGYGVRIALKQLDQRVMPGMTANVSIPVSSATDALAVPLAAIFTEMGERFVFVLKSEKYERRSVEVGVYDYDFAEVVAGLNAGEVVSLEQPPGEVFAKLAQRPPGDRLAPPTGMRPGGGGGGGSRPKPSPKVAGGGGGGGGKSSGDRTGASSSPAPAPARN